jgi:hypothetical protein
VQPNALVSVRDGSLPTRRASSACFELLDEERQGSLWRDDDLEEWERAEGEFPEDDTDDRAA